MIKRYAFVLLLLAGWILSTPRNARAQTALGYDGENIIGYSIVYSPYSEYQECLASYLNPFGPPIGSDDWCVEGIIHHPSVQISGNINGTPVGPAVGDYTASVGYYVPQPPTGTYYASSDAFISEEDTEVYCLEQFNCDTFPYGSFILVPEIFSSDYVTVQHLTYVTYNAPLVYVPGRCLSVSADPGIASVDFQYTWNGEFREEDGWPNGQASCLDVSQSQFFGSYQLLQAKSHADNAWAWVPAVGAVLLSLVEASPPQAVPTSFQILSVTTANNLNCGFLTRGFGAKVRYQVVDQFGSPVTASGMTPQEKVTIRGVEDPNFLPFSTPQTTGPDDSGQFDDVPIGTCFGPPLPSTNLCIRVFQKFNVVLDGTTYPIDTVTARTDCVQGIRVGTTPDDTTQLGTVN